MKMLTLLIFGPILLFPVFANEIMDPNAGKHFASIIKDVEVEDMLNNTSEFKDCREFNKFESGDSDTVKNQKIQKAEKCFREKLTKGKSEEDLKKLSEQLNLSQYGLVKSKSSQDLQKYLNDKMYKSMTGVDPNEKNLKKLKEDLKFGKKKHIDQAVFIEMYTTQLGKNALFEVSRFCFENLRLSNAPTSPAPTNFAEYWASYTPGSLMTNNNGSITLNVTDDGNPKFGTTLETEDKDKIYQDIFKSIQGANGSGLTAQHLQNFFLECGSTIVPLCESFEKLQKVKNVGDIKSEVESKISKGATACLTKSRLQGYRKALADAEKVAGYIQDKMTNSPDAANLYLTGLKGAPVKIYGKGADDETVDDLTNYASKDLLEGGFSKDELFEQAAKKCEARPELSECEGLISDGESFQKAKHNVEQELTLKREVEMARIRSLKDKKGLTDYLTENGYHDILEQFNQGKLNEKEIEEKVGQAFEAKKIALLGQMNAKLGKRQVQIDPKNPQTQLKANEVKEVIQESKEERARLAQMVLFNNIITSHLELKKGDGSVVGRNVNVWKKEEQSLESSQVNSSLFQNIKSSNSGAKGLSREDKISGFQIIDTLLGKPEDKKTK